MKTLMSLVAATVLLAGCASLEEAYYLDREFGQASQASWDKMVAHPDYRYANQTPDGLDGIHAEGIMKTYDDTYRVKPKAVDIISIGLGSGGNK